MKARPSPKRLYHQAIFFFGVLTGCNVVLSTGDPGWLALIVFGLATGAVGGTVLLEALRHHESTEGRDLGGRTRRKLALLSGVLFGAALTPATALASGAGGSSLFLLGLIVGGVVSGTVRRTLSDWIGSGTAPVGLHAHDHDGGYEVRMPTFVDDSTREQLAAGVVMMLGFVLSAGVILAVYAGFLAIMGR